MRLKKQIAEQLKQDIQEYYHMEDRIDEVKAKMTFNDNAEEEMKKEKNQIFFTKHLFFIFVILFSTILIGGSVGVTCLINYQHFNSEQSLFDKSQNELKKYLEENLNGYLIEDTASFIIMNSNAIINIHKATNDQNNKILFNLYSITMDNIECRFENNNYSKIFNNFANKTTTIGVLNDSSFPINAGDMVTGHIYLNNELNRKITLNF